ncbi:NirD/YgiW/YdeI family stress tolerance protein [Trinickia terrae]|uniref:NirD/YgiW/YdeI family stress tolerance protein n=1 Tax=Trinickia terrae TaxID=2571161 RepID=A0A4U1HKB5_9BURK|nr:NirD/YgiW/YdeI family stress tolerance protein [Trinickia terrae]TKC79076.1 NirD/YgiW/YdeI family stress tolerance protein [Trinickia terrae]
MKRVLTAAALCFVCAAASAQYAGPNAATAVTSVKALHEHARDDQYVTLQGRIVSKIGGDDYLFADDTGQVKVEIEPHLFPAGRPIDDKTRVRITGKFDKEWVSKHSEIEVDQLTVLD